MNRFVQSRKKELKITIFVFAALFSLKVTYEGIEHKPVQKMLYSGSRLK